MNIKTSFVCFFKDSLNNTAVTTTLELDEGNVSIFVKFEYERGNLKSEWVFEKKNTISHFLFTK